MTIPPYVKPGVWGVILGAIAMMIIGFWQFGWTTSSSAERMAADRANTAVVAALVPFCVAKAQQDVDGTKLLKFNTTESYNRSQVVQEAGWATMLGMTSPDRALASACADMLKGAKVS
ncbi:MAG: hypothetical protein HYR63_27815 [Proteobacteria bacterium]|nr:hypothetical protein [Pseudomonadota bacterium]MBI3497896.1 hypothetical protein [Pseudomonadota bacterium]